MKPNRRAATALAISAWACHGIVDPDDERRTLRENRMLFERQVGSSYSYDYRNLRFALGPVVEPVRIRVRDSAIVSVVSLSTGAEMAPDLWRLYETVESLFRTLEDAFDRNAPVVRVEYHPQYGHPTSVYIDYDRRMADEEAGYTLSNLTPEGN